MDDERVKKRIVAELANNTNNSITLENIETILNLEDTYTHKPTIINYLKNIYIINIIKENLHPKLTTYSQYGETKSTENQQYTEPRTPARTNRPSSQF